VEEVKDWLIAPETLSGYARQSVRMAQRRGYTIALVDASTAFAEALSAQGELLARNPESTKYELLDEGYNAIRREQRECWHLEGKYHASGTPNTAAVIYGVPTTHFTTTMDVERRIDAHNLVARFWSELSPFHRRMFALFADGNTWTETARKMGTCKMTLSNRKREALAIIHSILDS
jgi:hypothetical protein